MADNLPVFKIGSNFYDVTQIIDKSLYARKSVIRRDFTNGTTTPVTIAKGQFVGKVYSFTNNSGIVQFMLYGSGYLDNNFVTYEPDAFSSTALEAQGSLTVEEQAAAAAEANKSALEKFFDELGLSNIAKTISWGLPLFFVGYLGIKLYGAKNEADSLKQIRSNDNK